MTINHINCVSDTSRHTCTASRLLPVNTIGKNSTRIIVAEVAWAAVLDTAPFHHPSQLKAHKSATKTTNPVKKTTVTNSRSDAESVPPAVMVQAVNSAANK